MAGDGGGGSTALAELHPYQQNTHYALIGGSIAAALSGGTDPDGTSVLPGGVLDYLNTSLAGGNPYSTAFAYDPENDLTDVQDLIDDYIAAAAAVDPATDFTSLLATALTGVGTLISSTHIDDEVDAFETKTAPAFARSVNRLTGPMASANATTSSAFVIGMALLERGRSTEIDEYRAKLNSNLQQQRAALGQQFVSEMSAMLARKNDGLRAAAMLQHEMSRSKIIANREFLSEELELDFKDVTYELELFGYANQTLAAGLGAPSRPVGPSKASTQLASTLSAAATIGGAASPLGAGPALLAAGLSGAFTWFANQP